uniref:ATP-dependent Clp protease proteolytic subunit n=1 Tax=Onobrychis viciifolia TaxID=3882 RepID=A0A7T8V6P8_ONOVI|nr:ClpP [Onobrychis viciifolia]QPF16931.1 clp protease proteolytic subunit [Onobrychis viciifolia]QQQ88449.1 ClpP [Onobrychis viciifolia]
MPVGIPKIRFSIPGEEEEPTWVELYQMLFYIRIIFIGQEISCEISNQVCGMMVYLNIANRTEDIYLFINSPGGGLISGIAIFDTIQGVQPVVQTVCAGISVSMASFVLLGGGVNRRVALPHARIMIHQPATTFIDGGESMLEMDELVQLENNVINIYAQRTGKYTWQIATDMQRDCFMSAEEAQDYGIVDVIAEPFEDEGYFSMSEEEGYFSMSEEEEG